MSYVRPLFGICVSVRRVYACSFWSGANIEGRRACGWGWRKVVGVGVAAAVAALVLRMCVVLVMAVLVAAVAHTWLGA